MGLVVNFLLCSFVVVIAQGEVSLKLDRPSLRARLTDTVNLECCYSTPQKTLNVSWIKLSAGNQTDGSLIVNSDRMTIHNTSHSDKSCNILTIKHVQKYDRGLYQCSLNSSNVSLMTPGTYLLVYSPLKKTIKLSESTKNKILTAEGILLFLCVFLPAVSLLSQSKRINELEKKKMKKEEENIYQGLNLDDCCATYDQIERSLAHGPYQDVYNIIEEEEEIQLEKP